MGTIAKGEITLSPVNDAYTVSITPASCPIRASYDGSNPQLSAAKGNISVKMGNEDVSFQVCRIKTSSADIEVDCTREPAINVPFQLSAISTSDSEGWVEFDITTIGLNVYTTTVRFTFSVIRETTLLDWVMDWDGSKTKIGGTYIMTPKLFVGKKEDVAITQEDGSVTWKEDAITGVYIGPDLLATGDKSTGIYGYLNSSEIFHINAEGGQIGGWTINDNGLQSSNGVLNILSEGSIFAKSASLQEAYWKLNADGSAVFAKGNVKFSADGSAEFKGKVTSSSGKIGGWSLTTNQLNNNRVIIDSKEGCIAINATEFLSIDMNTGDLSTSMNNGVKLWYKSKTNYGLAGYNDGDKVFYIGSSNFIGGWKFSNQAIWVGTDIPQLNANTYTEENALTIAPNGIRSNKWYIDSDGTATFVGGKVKLNTENAEMFGWLMRDKRFSSQHATLIADSSYSGLFISTADLSEVGQYSLVNTIKNAGGIFLYSDGANSIMKSYDKQGNVGFFLSTSGYNQIGNWYFDHTSIYTGNRTLDDNGFANDSNSIILSTEGLRGKLWKFLADGSGAVAGGHIQWDADGNVSFDSNVKLSWGQITNTDGITNKLTNIDANGIYTGTISADSITAGTIASASIKSDGKWALNQDGSGFLASSNISWETDGTLSVKGKIISDSGSIAGFKITSGCIGVESSASQEGGSSDWANLTITKDFFKVGGSSGYVMFGNDVVPGSAGGAFTAAGRIVNQAPNAFGGIYGFDQANYGLFINVSGGTKNYGISSNAALKAPAFITTEALLMDLSSGTFSVDFSQHNIILLYYNNSQYSGVNVQLPNEWSVAKQFGLNSLPLNFAAVVTFRVRTGSKTIVLKGIYNHNEVSSDYTMEAGDSVQLLITKADGFRYQIINHSY